MVRKYPAQVVSISNPVDDIFTVVFESLGNPFKYQPGQYLHLALDEYDPTVQWPDSRCFSMQSSPSEKIIRISYSVKGQYTMRMQEELHPGKRVTLKLPFGDLFTQQHNKENTVFIAGGTGITPFLSLFTHESFNKYNNPKIYLGFRTREYNIYQDELNNMQVIRKIPNNSCNLVEYNSNSLIQLFFQNEVGDIDISQIFIDNGVNASYFISGPPAMIKAFKSFLFAWGVKGENILTDDWE